MIQKTKILQIAMCASLILNIILLIAFLPNSKGKENSQEYYPFLSKRIFAENQNDILINFIPLRQELRTYVEKKDSKVGFYFEYLPSGTSIGVNDKKEVKLASLSKVPAVMAILKKVEAKQILLDNKLNVDEKHIDAKFGSLWQAKEKNISVEELIKLTLIESDNTAFNVLLGQLTGQELNDVYRNLDILLTINPTDNEKHLQVAPKNYSSVFRSLYLSSYLTRENSNYILNLLSQTPFNDKIVAGLPENVKVSHKIGVFEEVESSENVYMDCGIIYVPNRPFILCAFVLDTNEQAQKHISKISKIIYDYIKEPE